MQKNKCPKCGSENIRESGVPDFSADNIFGFTEEDYENVPDFYCLDCNHSFEEPLRTDETIGASHNYEEMTIKQIARIIWDDWRGVDNNARPYLEAMTNIISLDDMYGNDRASEIVLYFLENSSKWKGEKAREIKKRLRKMLKKYY